MLKATVSLLLCVLALAGLVLVVGYSSCDGPPQEHGESAQADHPNQDVCSTPYATFKIGLSSAWSVVHEDHDEIIAVGTIFIAIFTIILGLFTVNLAGATDKLVKGAEKTAERQLRAYVNVANAKAKPDGEFFVYSIEVKNFGQTPAYKVRLRYMIELRDFPATEPFVVPDHPQVSVAVLPPTVPIHDAFRPTQILGTNQRQRLNNGTAAIYVYGLITYEDIFEGARETEFRYMIGGNVGVSPEGAVRICEEGNRAI
jgi:hypothetical protein